MATYTRIKKIKIGSHTFKLGIPEITINATNYKNYDAIDMTFADTFSITKTAQSSTDTEGNDFSTGEVSVALKLDYTTSGNNRAVKADSNGNLYVTQKDDNSGGTITQVKTTAGAHTTITTTSGAANFNVPTKTSHLTNDSGFITAHNTYTVTSSGSGNAVTAVSLSGTTFTVTKGTTFLTSHQSLSDCVSKSTTTAQSVASDLNTKHLYLPNGYGIYFSQTATNKPRIIGSSNTTYSDCLYYYSGQNTGTSNHYHAFYANGTGVFYITPTSVYTSNSATFSSAGSVTVTGSVTASSAVFTGGSFVVTSNGHCRPDNDTTTTNNYLGTSSYHWNKIYCKSSSIDTSDAKEKDVLGSIDYAKDFIMSLNPVEYQWKESDHKRIHMGFIAQEVAQVGKKLNKNLSVYEAEYRAPDGIADEDYDVEDYKYHGEEVDDSKLTWGLGYSELIAPTIKVVQDQQREIEDLKEQVIYLQSQILDLKSYIMKAI